MWFSIVCSNHQISFVLCCSGALLCTAVYNAVCIMHAKQIHITSVTNGKSDYTNATQIVSYPFARVELSLLAATLLVAG
jgi:hypothetical protein